MVNGNQQSTINNQQSTISNQQSTINNQQSTINNQQSTISMGKPSFENLQVYQLSEKLADEIWHLVREWNQFDKETVGQQIVRSADSIGANIAEGTGRYNLPDNRRFVKIARGSLNETIHWLRRAYNRKLLTNEQINKLKPIIDELSPKLNAYLNSLGH